MTPDEQEALSHKYFAHGILALSSGAWALFAPGYKLIGIYSIMEGWSNMRQIISDYEIPEPSTRATELSLEDLGL